MTHTAESWQQRYRRIFYESRPGWIDGTEEFHRLCAASIGTPGRILEIGAGPSNPTSRFLATLGEVHGLDPDPLLRENDALATAAVLEDTRFPFPEASFDACVSNYVIEHIADPAAHLREVPHREFCGQEVATSFAHPISFTTSPRWRASPHTGFTCWSRIG